MKEVEMFIPCTVDQYRPGIGMSMAKVLKTVGLQVGYRKQQGCCGGIHFQAGYWKDARELGIQFLKTFSGAKHIVTPSADCAIIVTKHYHELFFNTAWHLEFKSVGESIFEFCDFYVNELNNPELDFRLDTRVVVHPSCGLGNEYMQGREIESILNNIEGLELVELNPGYHSCGRGGLLPWNYPDVSAGIAEQFLQDVTKSKAHFIIVNEPACALHLSKQISRLNLNVQALHITELMAEALHYP